MKALRYLCVGINDYPGSGMDLSGCVNDALDMQMLLEAAGGTGSVLLDSTATKAAFLEVLGTELDACGYRDTLVVTYSGHGTWIPDVDGDEPDGRDEALVMHDYFAGGLVTDDDLYALFKPKSFGGRRGYGARVLLISDSCHSGSVTRAYGPQWADGGDARAKFMPPELVLSGAYTEQAKRIVELGLPARSLSRSSAALISGCADNEVSYDAWFTTPSGRRANGAMTQHLKMALAQHPTTLGGLYAALRTHLPSQRYSQTPQLSASASQKGWKLWT